MVSGRTLWECFGPPGAPVLRADGQAVLLGLKARPELNGRLVVVRGWDGPSGRFEVGGPGSKEAAGGFKVKAANLQPPAAAPQPAGWELCAPGGAFGPLPPDVVFAVAHCLWVRGVADLAAAARAARHVLWVQPESRDLWRRLLARRFGEAAAEVAHRARPGVEGPALFRTARALRLLFRDRLEVVLGSVVEQARGADVVACPVMRHLESYGLGAQGAVRQAAGPDLEAAVDALEKPVGELSVTLVPGGSLAPWVALTVTQPPSEFFAGAADSPGSRRSAALAALVRYVRRLHANLLAAVRAKGLRFLAMPTLCTGGLGIPAPLVAVAAVLAVQEDFAGHPADALRVRVACYEREHAPAFREVQEEVLDQFFAPEQAQQLLMDALSAPHPLPAPPPPG